MSAEVIPVDFKKQPRPGPMVPAYYCLRCDGKTFQIQANGEVHCTQCGSMMRNLRVVLSEVTP